MKPESGQVNQWLSAALASIGGGVIATNLKGDILFMNQTAEELTGWNVADAIGQPAHRILHLSQAHSSQTLDPSVAHMLRDRHMIYREIPARLEARGGRQRSIEYTVSPLLNQAGDFIGAIVVLCGQKKTLTTQSDLSESHFVSMKDSANIVSQTGLEQQETAALTMAVTEELRTPMIAVERSARLLAEGYAQRLGQSGNQFLSSILLSAQSMREMMEIYLALLEVTRESLGPLDYVDMEQMAHSVFNELMAQQGGTITPEFRVHAPNSCLGDPIRLRQAMIHLLSNAIKFTAMTPHPVIEVEGWADSHGHVYCVRDNGVGFQPRQTAHMFEAFRRFHSRYEFPGNGVGLAIVKRIIDQHGGKVWARSQPSQGAAFYIQLPTQAMDERASDAAI